MSIIEELISAEYDSSGVETTKEFMVVATQRSGSTYFCQRLWETGCLGYPTEYLSAAQGQIIRARLKPRTVEEMWRKLKERRTSQNGVFSLKIMSSQIHFFEKKDAEVLRHLPSKAIVIERKDKIAQAVSYVIAGLTNSWYFDCPPLKDLESWYDFETIRSSLSYLEEDISYYKKFLSDRGIETLEVFYEDFLANEAQTVQNAASFVGVDLDPSLKVSIPILQSQYSELNRKLAERFKSDLALVTQLEDVLS